VEIVAFQTAFFVGKSMLVLHVIITVYVHVCIHTWEISSFESLKSVRSYTTDHFEQD
jgi:hypothetical protein